MSATEITTYTAEDLLHMPDGDRYELVNGHLVEKKMSYDSGWVASELHGRIRDYLKTNNIGSSAGDGIGFQCFPDDPGKVRRPDASFIRAERFNEDATAEGHYPVAPDIAVEVISPSDTYVQVHERVQDYLSAGTSLVWVINPVARNAVVHRPNRDPVHLDEDGTLTGDDVLPGFECRVGDVLRNRAKE